MTEGTGERVGGYRVVRRLAVGGTSEVLLAKADGPLGFERTVVLKLLLSQYTHDPDVKAMFAREAAAYARLSHPSIVRLYDFFQHGTQLVMVLEYIDGPPLSGLKGMLKAVSQQLDDQASFYIAGCIFDALAAAHAATDDTAAPAPVIHRDVNPTNVLIAWDAHVKLADFGVAKVTGLSHQSSAGLVKGTYGYMAPEQVKGETVSPRADVYAGAIVLWEMLTKRRAFIRGALPDIEVLRELAEPRIMSIDVVRPDVDNSVRDALKRALEPRAERRTMTAEEMVSILRAVTPSEEGRERLARALSLVRHEPRPSPTSLPPPPTRSPASAPVTGPRGMLPARPRSDPPSSVPGLASVLEPSWPDVPRRSSEGGPAGTKVSLFDSLVEPPELVETTGRESEKLRLGTSPAGFSPRRRNETIDEILQNVPSTVPPDVFPKTDPPREIGQLPAAPPPLNPVARDLRSTLLAQGGSALPTEGAGGAMPSSFPAMNKTLAMYERVDVRNPTAEEIENAQKMTARPPPPAAMDVRTAPMPAVDPQGLIPSTAKMRAFVAPNDARGSMPPPGVGGAPGAGSSPPATLPLGGMTTHGPPQFAQSALGQAAAALAQTGRMHMTGAHPAVAPPASSPPGSRPPSVHSQQPQHPHAQEMYRQPPAPRRVLSVLALVAMLLVVVASGVAGTVAYARWQRAKAGAGIPPAITQGTATSSAAPAIASVDASSPSPDAGADADLATVASASTGAAIKDAAAITTADDLPAGMGRVKTGGTVPGRRIFVDERTVGQTPESVVVKCGARTIKLGSSGFPRSIDVPCGGEIAVGDR